MGERSEDKWQDMEGAIDELVKQAIKALVTTHAPPSWEELVSKDKLLDEFKSTNETPLSMIVLTADIRRSTVLMKEAISQKKFANALSWFFFQTREAARNHCAWIGNFTGDGIIVYWIVDKQPFVEALGNALYVCADSITRFRDMLGLFRQNTWSFPDDVGLSVGIDFGPTYLEALLGQPTILGPAVVGSRRMVDAAAPWETVCIHRLGLKIVEYQEVLSARMKEYALQIEPGRRTTKEYRSQEVYLLKFSRRSGT